jgi:hypothetical protein
MSRITCRRFIRNSLGVVGVASAFPMTTWWRKGDQNGKSRIVTLWGNRITETVFSQGRKAMQHLYYVSAWTTLLFFVPTVSAGFPDGYNIVWDSQSEHSGDSMPVSGGDIGLNVWVERTMNCCSISAGPAASVSAIEMDVVERNEGERG